MVEAWPAVSYEERPWDASSSMMSRTQQRLHRGPYRSAVVPEIAAIAEIGLPSGVSAVADDASTAIVRFDAEYGAAVAPFSPLLLRSESTASSRIELLTASARSILRAELGDRAGRNAELIVANTAAMQAAVELADQLDLPAISATHLALLGQTNPKIAGRWRDQQVWIGGTSFGPHRADYVAPHHERVVAAMADLVAFMARDDLPVLAHVAIAHAQFESIHPFVDGNGRTGRALIHAMLRAKRLTEGLTVPISAGLLGDTPAYFAALDSYRSGDPTAIVQAVADASFQAIDNGRTLIEQIEQVRSSWNDRLSARSQSSVWPLADLLMRQPIVDSPLVQRELSITAASALGALEVLVSADVVKETTGGRRNRRWAADEMLEALDGFAERSIRRSP